MKSGLASGLYELFCTDAFVGATHWFVFGFVT